MMDWPFLKSKMGSIQPDREKFSELANLIKN